MELLQGPQRIMEIGRPGLQKMFAVGGFVVGGTILFLSAEPFVEGMKESASSCTCRPTSCCMGGPSDVRFPELFTVVYWSRQGRAEQAFMNIVAADLNQVDAAHRDDPDGVHHRRLIEAKGGFAIRFDSQQRIEIMLTAAQGLFAPWRCSSSASCAGRPRRCSRCGCSSCSTR